MKNLLLKIGLTGLLIIGALQFYSGKSHAGDLDILGKEIYTEYPKHKPYLEEIPTRPISLQDKQFKIKLLKAGINAGGVLITESLLRSNKDKLEQAGISLNSLRIAPLAELVYGLIKNPKADGKKGLTAFQGGDGNIYLGFKREF